MSFKYNIEYDNTIPYTEFDIKIFASKISDNIQNNILYVEFKKELEVFYDIEDIFELGDMIFDLYNRLNKKMNLWNAEILLNFEKEVFEYLKKYYWELNSLKEYAPKWRDYLLIMYYGIIWNFQFIKWNKILYEFYLSILNQVEEIYDDSKIQYDIPLIKYNLERVYNWEEFEEFSSYSREEEIIKNYRKNLKVNKWDKNI